MRKVLSCPIPSPLLCFRSAFDVVFAVLLVFNAIGVLANVLVMLGIKLNKRSLLLPWLVFQLMVILGEFCYHEKC